MLLEANKIDHDFITVDALKGQNRKPEFRSEFPSGQVPTIKDVTGFKLGEAAAILQYICDSRKNIVADHWYPENAEARAAVNFWLHWHHSNTRVATTSVLHSRLFPTSVYPKLPRQTEKGEAGIKSVAGSLKQLESHLGGLGDSYVGGGDSPSIADLLLLTELDQHLPQTFGMLSFEAFPHVQAWMQRMMSQDFYDLEPVVSAAKLLAAAEAKRA